MKRVVGKWFAFVAVGMLFFGSASAKGLAEQANGELKLEVFVSEPNEINVTSALIMGPTEMMVMSAQGTKSSATRLADEIESKGLKLKYVFLSHPHLDHSQGAGILLQRFPEARFVATPEVAALQRHRIELDDAMAKSRHGDNAAVPSIAAEEFTQDHFSIDGHRVEIWKGIIGDAGIGHADEPHVALYVPTLKALMPSDVVYFDAHVMMGGSSKESRAIWRQQLERWMTMDLQVVVPGHLPKSSLAELTAQGALKHTYDYIGAYDQVLAGSDNADQVIEKMLRRYPDMQHQSALYLGTFLNFGTMHRLTFNPTVERIAGWLPDAWVEWLDETIFEKKKQQYNLVH